MRAVTQSMKNAEVKCSVTCYACPNTTLHNQPFSSHDELTGTPATC